MMAFYVMLRNYSLTHFCLFSEYYYGRPYQRPFCFAVDDSFRLFFPPPVLGNSTADHRQALSHV